MLKHACRGKMAACCDCFGGMKAAHLSYTGETGSHRYEQVTWHDIIRFCADARRTS